jgi:gliding motility-associated-like protein
MERSILVVLLVFLCITSYGQVAPDFSWAKSVGGDGVLDDEGLATAVDTDGNVYATGFFSGSGDFDPGTGVTTLTEAGGRDIFITKFDPAGNLLWAKAIGSTGQDVGNDITINYAGEVLVTGFFQGTVDFDPGNNAFLSTAGGIDAFILKLDPDGVYQWAVRVGANAPATGTAEGKTIAWDDQGNIYLAGAFTGGPVDFDPSSSAIHPVPSAGDYDGFVLKLNELGVFVWANTFGSTGADQALGVTVDYNYYVIATGSFSGTVDFDPGGANYDMTAVGSYSACTYKVNDSGDFLWARSLNSSGSVGHKVSTNSYAESVVMGVFSSVTNFDPGGTYELTPPNLNQTFLTKLDENGNFIFALQTEGTGTTRGFDLYVDVHDSDNIYITGAAGGTVDYDPGAGSTGFTSFNGYILSLDTDGTFRWVLETAAMNRSLAVDLVGNVFVAGQYSGSVDFNLDTPVETLTSVGGTDVFIQRFQSSASGIITIDQQPADVIACVDIECTGAECNEPSYDITVEATGVDLNYVWQKLIGAVWTDLDAFTWGPSEDYEDIYEPTLQVNIVPTSTNVQLRCRIYNAFAPEVFSNSVTVEIHDEFDARPTVVAVSGCGPGQYLVTASGAVDGNYQWYMDGDDPIDGAVNANFFTPEIDFATLFSVAMRDAFCIGPAIQVMVNPQACSTRPGMVWANTIGSGVVELLSMDVDAVGNIYGVGEFRDSPDFDPGSGVFSMTGGSLSDGFIIKLDADGQFVWAKQIGDISGNVDLDVDNAGNVYITGSFSNTIDIDPGTPVVDITSAGGSDIYILKLNTNGDRQWSHRIGGTLGDVGRGIITDAAGNVYVTGTFTGSVNFNPAGTDVLNAGGSTSPDGFILKMDALGNFIFVRRIGGTPGVNSFDIGVDASQNIYTTGWFSGTNNVDFDPGPGSFNLAAAGVAVEMYVHKLFANGDFAWAGRIGSASVEEPKALIVDNGHVYYVGRFQGLCDFDPGAGTFEIPGGGDSGFALKLTTDGNFVWARNLDGDQANNLAIDAGGNLTVVGDFQGTMDADPGSASYIFRAAANTDIFVTQLNAAGDFVWSYSFGASGYSGNDNTGTDVVVDGAGNILVGGRMNSTIDLDPGDCTREASPLGGRNMFLQKMHPDEKNLCINIQPQPAELCEGEPFELKTNATGTTNITYQWGKVDDITLLWEPLVEAAPYSGTTTATLTIETTGFPGAVHYQARVSGDAVPDDYSFGAPVDIGAALTAPGVTGTTGCAPGQYTLVANGSTDGNYRWYVSDTDLVIDGEVNHFYITPDIAVTTSYYVTIVDGNCESPATEVIADISSSVTPPDVTNGLSCTSGTDITLVASGGSAGQYRWYPDATDPIALTSSVDDNFIATAVTTTIDYYVAINDGTCESPRVIVSAVVNEQTPPNVTGGSACGPGTILLTASGSTDGNYRWYPDNVTTSPITGQVNSDFTTPSITSTTTYYVSVNDGTCESTRTPVLATINIIPSAPGVTNAQACTSAAVTLNATGGVNGQYRWYTLPSGGTAISGEVNSAYTTPVLTTTTPYYVSVNDGCEGTRSLITATIINLTAPVVNSSVVPTAGTVILCDLGTVTLTAPAGFASYAWSTGETTSSISVNASGTFTVTVTDASGCVSPVSASITVVHSGSCVPNQPPVIVSTTAGTGVEGSVTIALLDLISDENDNLDLTTLRIVEQPSSGASATINANNELVVDYSGVAFSGIDRIVIEICDSQGACTQQELFIEVVGEIVVYNAVSPNGDGLNDFFRIQYISTLDNTRNNHVWIYNRWGSVVFDIENYDNIGRVFIGLNNSGNEIPTGTYFYKIEFRDTGVVRTGYLTLR